MITRKIEAEKDRILRGGGKKRGRTKRRVEDLDFADKVSRRPRPGGEGKQRT